MIPVKQQQQETSKCTSDFNQVDSVMKSEDSIIPISLTRINYTDNEQEEKKQTFGKVNDISNNADNGVDKYTVEIPIISQKALIFNIDTAKILRMNYGIVGVLSGTLPIAPQQQTLLGFPLQLSVEEVLYLTWLKVGRVVDYKLNEKIPLIQENNLSQVRQDMQNRLQNEIKERKIAHVAKMEKLGRSASDNDNRDEPVSSKYDDHFIETHNDSYTLNGYGKRLLSNDNVDYETLENYVFASLPIGGYNELYRNFKIFLYLRANHGHYLMPGLRFGGKFISYPGDPLRYHSHLIVNTCDYYNDDIGLLEISNGGRLATGVKKLWLISGEKRKEGKHFGNIENVDDVLETDTQTVCFSIEWSGFG